MNIYITAAIVAIPVVFLIRVIQDIIFKLIFFRQVDKLFDILMDDEDFKDSLSKYLAQEIMLQYTVIGGGGNRQKEEVKETGRSHFQKFVRHNEI